MTAKEKRLAQRLGSLRDAVERLRESVAAWDRTADPVYRDSMIQRFEFSFELCWKAASDWLALWEGDLDPHGPRQVIAAGVSRNLIGDGNVWTAMLERRNLTVHIYDEAQIAEIADWVAANALEPMDALVERLAATV